MFCFPNPCGAGTPPDVTDIVAEALQFPVTPVVVQNVKVDDLPGAGGVKFTTGATTFPFGSLNCVCIPWHVSFMPSVAVAVIVIFHAPPGCTSTFVLFQTRLLFWAP